MSATDPLAPLLWSGSLTLSEPLGTLAPFSLDDRGDGLDDNPLWTRGVEVFIDLLDSTGVYRSARRLRILSAFYEEESGVLTIELGCVLGLLNNRTQPANVGNVTPGHLTPRIQVVQSLLETGDAPPDLIVATDYLAGDFIDFALVKANGSFIEAAQRLLTPEQYFLWVDAEGQVRFKLWTVPSLATEDRTRGDYESVTRERATEVLPSLVRSVGTKIVYAEADLAQVDTSVDTLALGNQQNGNYYSERQGQGITTLNANASFVATRVRTIVSGDYTSTLHQITETYYSRVSMGFNGGSNVTATASGDNASGYLFFPSNGFSGDAATQDPTTDAALESALVLARRDTATTYYNSSKQVIRQVTSVEMARDTLALHYTDYDASNAPTTAFQEELLTLSSTDIVNTIDTAANRVNTVDTTTCALDYGRHTDEAPVAGSESQVCNTTQATNQGLTIQYAQAGTQTEVPLSGTFYLATTALGLRQKEFVTEYALTDDQHARVAELHGRLLIGRKQGYEIAMEPTDSLLFDFEPFLRLDVTEFGFTRSYLIDTPSFGFTPESASFKCSGIAVEST